MTQPFKAVTHHAGQRKKANEKEIDDGEEAAERCPHSISVSMCPQGSAIVDSERRQLASTPTGLNVACWAGADRQLFSPIAVRRLSGNLAPDDSTGTRKTGRKCAVGFRI